MTPLVKLKRQCRNYTISDTKLYAKILASVSIITPVQFVKDVIFTFLISVMKRIRDKGKKMT